MECTKGSGYEWLMIEFQQTIHLVIHLFFQEILAWLDHWLNLVHYMSYLPKIGSKHSLYSWLPSGVNAAIYMTEACTHIDYTQSIICTQSREFPTLLHVGYHAIMDCIQFDMMIQPNV